MTVMSAFRHSYLSRQQIWTNSDTLMLQFAIQLLWRNYFVFYKNNSSHWKSISKRWMFEKDFSSTCLWYVLVQNCPLGVFASFEFWMFENGLVCFLYLLVEKLCHKEAHFPSTTHLSHAGQVVFLYFSLQVGYFSILTHVFSSNFIYLL